MIKTELTKDGTASSVTMKGSLNILMNVYRGISRQMRRILTENFGKEDGEKILEILQSGKEDVETKEEISKIINNYFSKEFAKKIASNDGLIKTLFGLFGKSGEKESDVTKTFEPGKKYVFDANLCRNDLSSMGVPLYIADVWINDCDGKVVDVKNSIAGIIDAYDICSDWCREVE